jgi:23S rRNA (guanosine2251-2'-O)-methyltransferase
MIFVLNNIRSAWNVGSAFRTADCLGASLVLVGYTPRPVGSNIKLINKTAIGAENYVQWQEFELANEVFENLNNNVHLAAEITNTSLDIFDFINKPDDQTLAKIKQDKEVVIWFGNEISGVEPEVLTRCDKTLHLPMWGQKESLNIASSLAAFGYLIKFGMQT